MGPIGEAAASYARAGWAVLPLTPRNKVPAIKGGCNSASCDPEQVQAWWGAHPDCNVAVATGAPSGNLVVIDIDVDGSTGEDGTETLYSWEREHGELPETVTAITGRGGLHMYYLADSELRSSVNKELGVDIRARGGFTVAPPSIHPNGRPYCWECGPDEREVARADDNVMSFIAHVQAGTAARRRFSLPATIGAGERNDVLFRYASSLQEQGYDDVYISMALEAVNRQRCAEPIGDAELDKIVGSVTGRYAKGEPGRGKRDPAVTCFRKRDSKGNPTGPVLHNVVGRELIERHRACCIDGAPAIWDGQRYVAGWDGINRKIVDLIDDCKMADQREVRNYVFLKAPRVRAAHPRHIAFTNGVLDIESGKLSEAGDAVITNVVPHDYDPGAYCREADEFLKRVSCGDATVRANLEEIVGLCMYRSNEFGVCPVLIGAGSNGKSTYLLALRNVLGGDNVSSLDISVIGRPFQAGRLLGKLANLGDDISNERLSGDVLAVFKKVCTGEWIYTDVKNGEGFEFKPFCTMVFSCNEFPALGDSSDGMMRRLHPIPFEGTFTRESEGFDPRISEKLTSEPAARYLARLGVEGLMRVRAMNGLTANARSEELRNEVKVENDNVLQWIADCSLGADRFAGQVIADVYRDYSAWCLAANLKPYGRQKFTRKINARYGFTSAVERRLYSYGSANRRVFR